MSQACTPKLVGGASPVSVILLPSKTAKFPFLTMDHSPWSSKNLINQNWLKKFMQVGIDVTSMQAWVKYMTIVFNYNYKYLEKVQLQIQIQILRTELYFNYKYKY